MKHLRNNCFPVVLSALIAGIAVSPAQSAEKQDIVDTAVAAGSFKTLAAALGAADLVDALKGKGPFTVFAPTDDAFAKLPKGTVKNLLKPENKQALVDILTYHVVSGQVTAKTVVTLTNAPTLNGQRVDIATADGKVKIDQATVTAADILCSNGVIHVIDTVILPSTDNIPTTAAKAKSFATLLAAVKAAELGGALSGKGPLTVFAPTDDAFAKLPEGTVETLLKPENQDKLIAILKYHVVPGRIYSDAALSAGTAKTLQGTSLQIKAAKNGATVNNAKLLATDIDATNGVIHVIDTVLLPAEKKNVSSTDAKKMIERAVFKGVHLYNSGHHAACSKVYQQTARQLVQQAGDLMPPLAMTSLQSSLKSCAHSQCASTNAWTMRRSLNLAYHHLNRTAR